ncbi:MAG: hypothetical protein JSS89_04365 [Bacteroidetes bacterium]|nr:hypothetical protein [Bacteroidota bacterium]
MDSRDDVFALVKSLTASEKRFFTLHARRHASDPHYLRMYEVLDALPAYDEAAVRRAFEGTPAAKHLAVIRHTLIEEIISSLATWSLDRMPDDVVQRECDAARFLADKGCRSFAERHVRKALAIAVENELPVRVLEVCALQRRLYPDESKHLRTILDRELLAVTMIHELHTAQRAVMEHDMAEVDLSTIHSRVAHVRWLRRAMHAAVQHGITSDVRNAMMAIVAALRAVPDLYRSHSREWCDTLQDMIVEASLHRDRETLRDVIDLISDMRSISHPLAVRRLLDTVQTVAQCAMALHNGTPERAIELHADGSCISPSMLAVWGVHRAALHLAADRAQMALQLINEVLNDPALRTEQPRWYGQALILNVMIHYAMGNEEYVPYCIRSAQRKGEAKHFFSAGDIALLRTIGRIVERNEGSTMTQATAAISTSPLITVIRAWAVSLDRRVELDLHRTRVGAA